MTTASTTSFATASVTASPAVFAVVTAMSTSSAIGASTTATSATIAMQPLALLKSVADKQTLYETCSVYREFRRHIGKR